MNASFVAAFMNGAAQLLDLRATRAMRGARDPDERALRAMRAAWVDVVTPLDEATHEAIDEKITRDAQGQRVQGHRGPQRVQGRTRLMAVPDGLVIGSRATIDIDEPATKDGDRGTATEGGRPGDDAPSET